MSLNQGNMSGGHPPPAGVGGPGGPPQVSNPIQMPEQSQPVDLATTSKQPLRIPSVPRPTLNPSRTTGGVAILGKSLLILDF